MKKEFFNQETVVFAHRGMPRKYPENTLPSFRAAIEIGAHVLETDIHLTKDNKFAVIHDSTLERTTNGQGTVSDYSLEELKKLDAGYFFTPDGGKTFPFRGKGIILPSLDELLNEFPKARFNIDLKDKKPAQVDCFLQTIKKHGAQKRVLAASRHYSNTKKIRKAIPEMATSLSLIEIILFYICAKLRLICFFKTSGDALQIPEKYKIVGLAKKSIIKGAHKKGLPVHFWTINHKDRMKTLIQMGADGIFSDVTDVLAEAAQKNRRMLP